MEAGEKTLVRKSPRRNGLIMYKRKKILKIAIRLGQYQMDMKRYLGNPLFILMYYVIYLVFNVFLIGFCNVLIKINPKKYI